ncbi:MAG: TetR/AcrR family transcriptional regulator [Acidimicrobiales bacterium]
MDDEREHGDPGRRRAPDGSASTSGGPGVVGESSESTSRAAAREHLLVTFIECVARLGYRRTHVDDVCRRSGVSNRRFYEGFGSKHDCYLMVFDTFGKQVTERARGAAQAASGPWETRVRAALEAAIGELVTHPLLVQFLLEYRNVQEGNTAMLRLIADAKDIYLTEEVQQNLPPVPREAQESVVSNLVAQLTLCYVEAGKLHRLPDVVPWVLYHGTLHLLGPDRAAPLRPPHT